MNSGLKSVRCRRRASTFDSKITALDVSAEPGSSEGVGGDPIDGEARERIELRSKS